MKENPQTTSCPICKGNYLDIWDSEEVCEEHSDWVVTFCLYCKNHCFSLIPGMCLGCFQNFLLDERIQQNIDLSLIIDNANTS